MDNRNKSTIKRVMAVLLCAFIFVAFAPDYSLAFGDESDAAKMVAGSDAKAAGEKDAAGSDAAAAEIDGGTGGDDEDAEAAGEKDNAGSEDAAADIDGGTGYGDEAAGLDAKDAAAGSEATGDGAADDDAGLELSADAPVTAVPADGGGGSGDADSLLEGYVDSRLKEELSRASAPRLLRKKPSSSKRRETLSDGGKVIYDGIVEFARSVAAGGQAKAITTINVNSVFSPYYVKRTIGGKTYNSVTSQSLGISGPVYVKKTVNGELKWTFSDEASEKLFSYSKVLSAMLADEPYVFYWFDKTAGNSNIVKGLFYLDSSTGRSDIFFEEGKAPVLEASLSVSLDYRSDLSGSAESRYSVDTAKTGAASAAAVTAAQIINDNKTKSDFEKLTAYKDSVCDLTEYNNDAIDNNSPYGDPWQMIHVFDGDPATRVVCEGYAKAFQYLCDNSDFEGSIECDTVTGPMHGSSGEGQHMWNILHMDDGENYLADITNSDSRKAGQYGALFLKGAMAGGSVAGGYGYDVYGHGKADITYTYDSDTRRIFPDSDLIMSETDYDCSHAHVMTNIRYEWSADGKTCKAHATCANGGEALTRTAAVTSRVKTRATCTTRGVTTYTAAFRQAELQTQTKDVADIPATGHSYSARVTRAAAEGVTGIRTYTCSRCGAKYTESIPAIVYPQDLPAVKISKPKAGKKKVTVKWKKVSKKNLKKIQGIEIQVATDSGFKNIVKRTTAGKKKTSKVVKGLKSKTKYYVRIRAYRNVGGVKHVSAWKKKSVKVK